LTHIKPIFDFKEYHVWDFIEGNGLKYPSLYDEGFSRIGCVICPFLCAANQKNINRNRDRWPTYYKTFEHAVCQWWHKREDRNGGVSKKTGLPFADKTPQEYLEMWYHGFEPRDKWKN
jgi:phosphoadenosine phosphosulfate reductase